MARVVLYFNQFFGGIGGEDKADLPPRLTEEVVGPGRAYIAALGDQAEVVATVICGDNYFAENIEAATREVKDLIAPYRPDLLFAGPAFNAGRYGIACGAVCRMARTELQIPAVTGMYEENPGLDLYRKDVYIVKTGDNARSMAEVVKKMTALGQRLLKGDKIGRPDDEGYFSRGVLANEVADKTGAERVVDMLLHKMRGEPYLSEVPRLAYDRVTPAHALKDIRSAKIALVTDGGLVPKGNPDKIEMATATRYGRYDITAKDALDPADYEVNHGGYDSRLVVQDPNRLVPVDVMREMEREGVIGALHNWFYSTTGLTCIVEVMKGLGKKIGESLKAEGVSGVILTST